MLENAVEVKFEGNAKSYFFKNTIDNLSKGDLLMVETKNGPKTATYIGSRSLTNFDKGHPTMSVLIKV